MIDDVIFRELKVLKVMARIRGGKISVRGRPRGRLRGRARDRDVQASRISLVERAESVSRNRHSP